MKASFHPFFDNPEGLWQYSLKSHFNPKVYLKITFTDSQSPVFQQREK